MRWRRVIDSDRYLISSCGKVWDTKSKRFLNTPNNNYGYPFCQIVYTRGRKKKLVHRLVAEAFIPNEENSPIVNHLDGNKENPNVDNLEWTTYSNNSKHAYDTGLNPHKGENSHCAKLTEEEAISILKLKGAGIKQIKVAEMFGCHFNVVSSIWLRKTWKHISI